MSIKKAIKDTAEYVFKNGKRTITEGAKNGANGAANGAAKRAVKKAPKPPPRVLNKADYEGTAGGHSGFGRFKADMAAFDDKRKGLQKPLFKDEAGDLHYHQSNGQKPSQFRHRDDKQAEVLDRDQKGKQQSKPGVTGKSFLKDRPQIADTEAHHIAPIKSLQFLFDGLNERESLKLIEHFEKRGVYIGNDARNRADLSSSIHTSVHESYVKRAILKYDHASLEGMSLKERLKFANVILQEIKEAKKIVERESEVWITPSQLNKSMQRVNKPELAIYDNKS